MMSPRYWEYFKAVEADLEATSRYVDFNQSNYKTYSNEFAKILMIAGSEIDSVMKQLCKSIDSTFDPNRKNLRITDYFPIITTQYSQFCAMELGIPRYDLVCSPWEKWTKDARPGWWKSGFTNIKHNRHEFFEAATLENCVDAVGGLLITILHYYDATSRNGIIEIDIRLRPSLFSIAEETIGAWFWHPSVPTRN